MIITIYGNFKYGYEIMLKIRAIQFSYFAIYVLVSILSLLLVGLVEKNGYAYIVYSFFIIGLIISYSLFKFSNEKTWSYDIKIKHISVNRLRRFILFNILFSIISIYPAIRHRDALVFYVTYPSYLAVILISSLDAFFFLSSTKRKR